MSGSRAKSIKKYTKLLAGDDWKALYKDLKRNYTRKRGVLQHAH